MTNIKHPTIERLNLGELSTNCYVCWCPDTLEAVIIDPADSGETITNAILERQLTPTAILLTHGHFDHVLALLELKLNFDPHTFLHALDFPLIKNAQKSAEHWLKRSVDPIPLPSNQLEAGSVFHFGHCVLSVIETPGHTPGSVCFVSETAPDDVIIFTGDTLFKSGVGRTDFSYSSTTQLEKSLSHLCEYPDMARCYPGHGESTTIGAEKINLGYV
jgi:hydroxyacylglutathione hydrolase